MSHLIILGGIVTKNSWDVKAEKMGLIPLRWRNRLVLFRSLSLSPSPPQNKSGRYRRAIRPELLHADSQAQGALREPLIPAFIGT